VEIYVPVQSFGSHMPPAARIRVMLTVMEQELLLWINSSPEYLNPVPYGPLCPPLFHGSRADLPYKNKADLLKCYESRATVLAALSLKVS
jgi:hypothetical protein